ncbi:hypothetical protein [Paraburkholderia tuberum]|uniref:Uncharacterized protein n=1 Tax=Paraburkholderia tuberum TaxID=157910 RepID=A0A1H1GDI5_9BURK|nr:hypothetical protein [Paraburkholderia tuberum]SDR11231.1 hypothetical protein SAMN05445850_2843 [Paraburkholderia tuberum]
MPVDLKQLGPPKSYPPRGPGIRVWILVWVACVIVVDGAILLLWPHNQPARGAIFWLPVAGLPNVLFLIIAILTRAGYEGAYLHAMFYNDHREQRRRRLIERGQEAVRVLDYSYRLAVADGALSSTITEGTPVLKAQPLRDGTATARHTRLPDNTDTDLADPLLAQVLQQVPVDRTGRLYAQLLAPLVRTIRPLLRAGLTPAVRLVVADPAGPGDALKQLQTVIGAMNLYLPDCKAVAADDGLMPVDAWLDAEEKRPLLVVAVQLHDKPPEDSAEGGVALLFLRQAVALPEAVTPRATLHRPVAVPPQELAEGLALSLLWGRVTPSLLKHAWLTGFDAQEQTRVTQASRRAGLEPLTKFEARRMPDTILGHAGRAASWIAVAAVAEHGADAPQLILSRTPTASQATILQAHPQTS